VRLSFGDLSRANDQLPVTNHKITSRYVAQRPGATIRFSTQITRTDLTLSLRIDKAASMLSCLLTRGQASKLKRRAGRKRVFKS